MKKKNNLTKELKLKKTIVARLTPKEMGRVMGGHKTIKDQSTDACQTTSTTAAQCTTA